MAARGWMRWLRIVMLVALVLPPVVFATSQPVRAAAYTENFDTLASSGTSSTVPAGWAFSETDSNADTIYTAGTGSSTTGDTYSFGAAGNSERAFGGLLTGTLDPTIGAQFQNTTGATITSLAITYYCEQWRTGLANRNAADRMDFQYSFNATSLSTGDWISVDALDCLTTNISDSAGAKNGNAAAYRTAVSGSITGLSIANGATYWLRWTDFNIADSDDGLAIDDFSLIPTTAGDTTPTVSSTTPASSATDVAMDANISVTFSEAVTVNSGWYAISCASSGTHTAAVTGGPTTFTLNPDTDFANSETCTVTIDKDLVADQDGTADNMAADYIWTFTTLAAPTGCTELFFSEYIEGSSYNKALEIYNGTSAVVNLSAYSVELYTNGSATASDSATLSGNLNPGEVFVIAHTSADAAILVVADVVDGGLANFNGDDALVLKHNSTIVDVIGQIGADPGTEWGSGVTSTADNTLRRKLAVSAGDSDGSNAFDPVTEWDGYAADTFTGLGSHIAACGSDFAPAIASTSPGNSATGVAPTANVLISFSEAVDVAAGWYTISCSTSGAHTAVVNGGPTDFTLNPDSDFTAGESCTVSLDASTITDQDTDDPPDAMETNASWTFTISSGSGCGNAATFIHTLQGATDVSPLSGSTDITIEGVVVGDYQGATKFNGFFVQEEDSQADSDPATSEGVFVYYNAVDVNVGDIVRVQGDVVEYFNLTEMTNVDSAVICPGSAVVSPASVSLPVTALTDWERYEGMLINIPQTLHVTELYQLGRYGQIALSVNDRLLQPTNVYPPSANPTSDRALLQDLNDRSRILLDDGNSVQNPDPITYPQGGLTAANTLRAGYTLPNLSGVLTYAFSNYVVQPTTALNFTATNPRPAASTSDTSQVRVASFNVLNYFVTFNSRGAENQTEFDRQRAKTISAILQLNADVIGLMEMENHSSDAALQDLVTGLNASAGAGTYAYVDTGVLGTDAIKVALIYKTARVSLVGNEVTNTNAVFSRPPLAQTFQQSSTGEQFTVIVNHFKSKGCDGATGQDLDQDDGQGCYNDRREQQATALTAWINSTVLPGATGSRGALIIGDLNAYAMEDPVTLIKNAGYVDMIKTFIPAGAYSYVFDGQSGYLDHALANSSLAPWVAAVQEWHINADEPTVLDYNTNYKTANQIATLYAPDAYRASDHDPVLVLLDFVNTYVDDDYTASTLGWGTNRFATIQGGINAATVGRTVYVENLSANAETYAESVTLNKAITLAIQNGIRLNGSLTLQNGVVEAPAGALTLSGNFTHSGGTFNHHNGTVVFDGAGIYTYAGSGTTFYNLTVNAGAILNIGPGFAVANTVTNNGGLQESKSVNSATVAFLNISTDKYFGVNINTTGNMGATTVTVWGNQACPEVVVSTVLRCFDITPTTAQTAQVTFYYRDAEKNGNTAPILWHWNGSDTWQGIAGSTNGGSGEAYWVQGTVAAYSPFALGDYDPTATTLASFTAAPQGDGIRVTWETATELENLGFNLYRGENAAGPWTQINTTLIPVQNPGATFGASYEWLDTGVTPEVTYFYRLEDVSTGGTSTFHGPVSAAAATPSAVVVTSFGARGGTPVMLLMGLAAGFWKLTGNQRRKTGLSKN